MFFPIIAVNGGGADQSRHADRSTVKEYKDDHKEDPPYRQGKQDPENKNRHISRNMTELDDHSQPRHTHPVRRPRDRADGNDDRKNCRDDKAERFYQTPPDKASPSASCNGKRRGLCARAPM